MRAFVRLLALSLAILMAFPSAYATCGGGGGGGMGGAMPRGSTVPQTTAERGNARVNAYAVPWRTLNAGEQPLTTPLVAYWFPASAEEMKSSEILNSRLLTVFSAQCVGMQQIRPEDSTTIVKWNVQDKRPIVLLTSGDKEIARVESERGLIPLYKVENIINNELYQRAMALDQQLTDAESKAKAGDKEAAVATYQRVWEQRCLAPDRGRQAQKALRRLGVTVKDAQLRTTDPVITPQMNEKMVAAMSDAFIAELKENYDLAKKLYIAAAKIDPADPVPLRFLGELYRHHTGEWEFAMEAFDHLLTMQPDPLSRAVALHGIGKMTIHMGNSAKGLALFEQSIAAYPLALTYRNMAVYWNSERQRVKADGYVRHALALDPEDPYNLIFAATYMADSGRAEEALKIAKENESFLSASYNLAAIYALLGNKGKAMDLLKRHFYSYERYDAVRAKEMWEARVDYVFASMKDDPEFVKLTYMAK
jgi:tetratricopeptide (TPR) repeat protein